MNRKDKIKQIIKEAKLNKIAEDITNDVNLAKIEDSEEYAHKVFEALLNNLHIDTLDDE